MGKIKWDYQAIKKYVENESMSGCILISKKEDIQYNRKSKIKVLCGKCKKEIFEVRFDHFINGKHLCGECSGMISWNIKKVKTFIENIDGFQLLSNEYNNVLSLLTIKCDKGHIFNNTFETFHKCPTCSICHPSKQYKYNFNNVKQIFELFSCELLESVYIGIQQKLKFKCSCGNISHKTFSLFLRSPMCSNCGYKKSKVNNTTTYEEVVKIFIDNGCELLSPKSDYINLQSKLKYKCSCGNISMITVASLLSGSKCRKCSIERRKYTCLTKFGVDNPMKNVEIHNKALETLSKNNNVASSLQQQYLHSLLGGELNLLVGNCFLDIAFPSEKIYIEFNGGGHDLQIKMNQISHDDFLKKENRRFHFLKDKGWKMIVIETNTKKLPKDTILLDIIKLAKEYLNSNNFWIRFNIDNGTIKTSQFVLPYNFGQLNIIKKVENQNKMIV